MGPKKNLKGIQKVPQWAQKGTPKDHQWDPMRELNGTQKGTPKGPPMGP